MTKKALAVGVSGYGSPNDLPNCARDAEAFGTALETMYRFDHVRILKDDEATREAIDRGLDWLFQGATANDRLVFFFSGPGCRIEKSGVIEEALVLPDNRLLDDHYLVDRMENLPPGVLTVVLDCCFSGLDELLLQPTGEVEVARTKRWITTDLDRGRSERSVSPGIRAFTPFGHVKPASLEALASHLRGVAHLDPSPARLITLAEPQARAVLVLPCLSDEVTVASTSQTDGLSPFTYCLLNEIRRLGPNRSTIELLHATGYELRRLGLRQTPVVKEPLHPEHLGLRAFLTLQPGLFAYPSSGPGREADDDLTRSIAEAVRNTLSNIKEGRSMQATYPGQALFGEDIGTIVNTMTPIVASVLQGRGYQPYASSGAFAPMGFGPQGSPAWGGQGWQGQGAYGWSGGGFGQKSLHDEIGQIVGAVVPAVLWSLQSRGYQQPHLQGAQFPPFQGGQFQPGAQFQGGQFQPWAHFQSGAQFPSPLGAPLAPYEIAQIVTAVAPVVASCLQSRAYQGHFGQFMPRAF